MVRDYLTGVPLRPPAGNGVINGTADDANIVRQKIIIIPIDIVPPSLTVLTKQGQKRKRKNNKNDCLYSMATRQIYILDREWEPTVEVSPPDDNGDKHVREENKNNLTAKDSKTTGNDGKRDHKIRKGTKKYVTTTIIKKSASSPLTSMNQIYDAIIFTRTNNRQQIIITTVSS